MHRYAILDEINGLISICAVEAQANSGPSHLCYFRHHVGGAPWPNGACHWVANERLFDSLTDALVEARAIAKHRVEQLSLNFSVFHTMLDRGLDSLEMAPRMILVDSRVEPVQRPNVWELLRRPEV